MSVSTEPQTPIVAVGGVVYRRNRRQIEVLLIKKRNGFWTLPKGKVKNGESAEEALVREIDEETGMTGPVGQPVRSVSYEIRKAGRPRTKIVTYYLVHARAGELRPCPKERIEKIGWFPINNALRRIHRPRVRKVVERASALLAEEASRPTPAE